MKQKALQAYLLGRVPYQAAWDLQRTLAKEVAAGGHPPALLLLEHEPTYTFGRRGNAANLLWDEAQLNQRGIDVHWVDRGGDVTFHGPGQLVGYPIMPVAALGAVQSSKDGEPRIPQVDYVGYLRKLEDVLIRTLASFGIVSGQVPGLTGVWVQPNIASRCPACPPEARTKPSKIASIGVKVDVKGISLHGFALNMSPDMSCWEGIIGCGLVGYPMICMADLLREPPSMEEVTHAVIVSFEAVFRCQIQVITGQPAVGNSL